ncbi:dephospho-CoA kinase [Armatimonas sp.]|uniref:dephospho-CoA kinase n=1 Tax=Armatimonas sp. TaxID=1872638 RepID=UPI00286B237B|nr:dephospho-CoA kinase [Armatimonas sp.]
MHIWAITGGIACGKSTVSKLFAECGAKIASADEDARAVLAVGETTRVAVLEAFGTIDRTELAAKIFGDTEARKRLNGIMHPAIRQRMRTVIDAAQSDSTVGLLLYEVPLLFEGGLETWFQGVVAVAASPQTQLTRLKERGLSDDAAQQRLASQLDPKEKVRRADFVVHTDTTLAETKESVQAIYQAILQSVKTPI